MESVVAASEHHTSIDLEDPYIPLVTSIREELQSLSPLSSECCIYRVPKKLRQINEKACTPQVVSIGPLHHGKDGLEAMEVHKRRYLQNFLGQTKMSLEDFVKFIKDREARIRNCYAETIELSSDDFVKMIVVDAAFTIEVLWYNSFPQLVDGSDHIFNKQRREYDIYCDMLRLENQLPFFILQDLFEATKTVVSFDPGNWLSIIELTHKYFMSRSSVQKDVIPEKIFRSEIKHFTDFIRICYLPSEIEVLPKALSKRELSRSLTELHEAGVKFKVASSTNLLDIKFANGILEMQHVVVTQNTEPYVQNVIAFEQCHYEDGYLSDYIIFMVSLINTVKDVELLIRAGIIENWLGDNLEVSTFFNTLSKGISFNFNSFYFSTLCEDLNRYCRVPRHKWKAMLKHDYFNSPWAVISIIAAVVLLILTLVQSVCSIISLDPKSVMEIVDSGRKFLNSIDLEDPYKPLVTSIRKELQSLSPLSSECCIYRVPKKLREINEEAYTPQVVSIGPLHHKKEGLEAMGDHKWRYLQDFLNWAEMSLEDLVKFIKEREARIRNCYAETIVLNSDDFVKMIVADATFTIVVLLKFYYFDQLVDASDRIFGKPWMMQDIDTDMLLLENQLPFFILQDLFDAVKTAVASDPADDWPSIIVLTHAYFAPLVSTMDGIPGEIFGSEIKHFLDFIRICVLPSEPRLSPKGVSKFELTPSLTKLYEAGVKLKVSSSNNLLDIQFSTNGFLEIPYIQITDKTESFFRNLIAFERCHYICRYITDYIATMDSLVNTPKDVELLIHAGILENWLGDNLEVSTLFNNLGKEIVISPKSSFYFSRLCEDLNTYCKLPWHNCKATLKHDHFKSPWAVISFIAAVILLILTFVQSLCSIISL